MADNLKSIAELSQELGIAESTARRWAKQFSEFLPSKEVGRGVKYYPQAKEVLMKVSDLLGQGHIVDEVQEMLRNSFTRSVEVEVLFDDEDDDNQEESALVAAGGSSDIPEEFKELLKTALSEVIKDEVAVVVEDVVGRETKALREELQQRDQELAATVAKLHKLEEDRHHREEERDKQMVSQMRSLLDERKKEQRSLLQRLRDWAGEEWPPRKK